MSALCCAELRAALALSASPNYKATDPRDEDIHIDRLQSGNSRIGVPQSSLKALASSTDQAVLIVGKFGVSAGTSH